MLLERLLTVGLVGLRVTALLERLATIRKFTIRQLVQSSLKPGAVEVVDLAVMEQMLEAEAEAAQEVQAHLALVQRKVLAVTQP